MSLSKSGTEKVRDGEDDLIGKRIAAKRILLIVLTVLAAGMIFYLSADSAERSSAKSDAAAGSFYDGVLRLFDLTDEQIEFIGEKSVFIVRKTAHIAEYAVLGFLLAAVCASFGKTRAGTVFISFAAAALYAVSDEVHQYFVPGRSCELRDMCIDSLGALVGIAFFMLIFAIFKTAKKVA